MNKNIFIFDEYLSSCNNGIGTYVKELLHCLNNVSWNINLIVFNAEVDEFEIVTEKGLKKYLFPELENKYFLDLGYIVSKLLSLYIKDDSHNIYFINHAPCSKFIRFIKRDFPLSKLCYVIHDFSWTKPFLGNVNAYSRRVKTWKVNEDVMKDPIWHLYKEDKQTYALVDKIICLCQDTCQTLKEIYQIPHIKIEYIPNGHRNLYRKTIQSKNKIREEFHLQENNKVILFIGRLTKQKGIFDLIGAMKLVLQSYPHVKLVFVGSNEDSMSGILEKTSSNANSFIFTGRLNKTMVQKWLLIADIGIIPSYNEQCSYTAIEMMMYGLPIIASDGFGIRNLFQDGVNAKIAHIGKQHTKEFQQNISYNILELLDSSELREELARNVRKLYEEKYEIRFMKKQYINLIKKITLIK
ncbi:glycosyltransferase [Bacteroides sp. 519]|uniref:glycosyltransferase n=1 Tax=Bacteroides sp. 519 TaxID=2302937 RepID=UPI0013D4D646|nr:glycosyltransferase [Bacteroides sp. 519]NDV60661.1 glycosyltransferase [Bacteroides sp. 519]